MPRLTVEVQNQDKPILFLIGEKNPLIPCLITEFEPSLKIAQISHTAHHDSNIYHVQAANAALIKNLKEKIGYAVIFCESVNIKEYLSPVFEKFVADNTKVAVICDLTKLHEFEDVANSIRNYPNFNFLISGDVYSEIHTFTPESETAKLIDSAIHDKEITLGGNDLKPLFPIYYKDAIFAIKKVILGTSREHVFYLFYSNPHTYLSAIHILQRIEPDLKVVYEQHPQYEEYSDFSEIEEFVKDKLSEKPVFLDQYLEGFEKSIAPFFTRKPSGKEDEQMAKLTPKRIVATQKPKIKYFSKALLLAVVLFITIQVAASVGAVLLLKDSIAAFQKGDYKEANNAAYSAKAFFDLTNPASEIAANASTALGTTEITSNYKIFSDAVNLTSIAAADANNISKVSKGISEATLDKTISDSFYLYFAIQKLTTETNNATLKNISLDNLSDVLTISGVAKLILGYTGEKHYLLLFQNNGELRPTGGFIGSVGEVAFKNGKMIDFNLQDVYEYDGQLKNRIEPHFILRRYIQPNLYLRDSNFDPDFQESAAKAALIYNLETGRKVDGVIAINFEAVKQIIGAIGPIELTSYKKTLNSENAFAFLQQTIDNNFFPGSTQKKDVLQALYEKIILTLEDPAKEQKVISMLPKLAFEKNIIFAFNQDSVQNAFSATGLAGDFNDKRKIESNKINDYLAINEANIGVNKANINIQRSTDYIATLSVNQLKSKITHRINNSDEKNYKAYIRVFTPLGSNLTSIKINGVDQKIVDAQVDPKVFERRNFSAPEGLEVDRSILYEKTVFGFIVDIDPKSDATIEVEYDNGVTFPKESIVDYSLSFIKQPGVLAYPFSLNIIYGANYTPKQVESARLENGVIIMDRNIRTDEEFEAEFLRR